MHCMPNYCLKYVICVATMVLFLNLTVGWNNSNSELNLWLVSCIKCLFFKKQRQKLKYFVEIFNSIKCLMEWVGFERQPNFPAKVCSLFFYWNIVMLFFFSCSLTADMTPFFIFPHIFPDWWSFTVFLWTVALSFLPAIPRPGFCFKISARTNNQ